MTMEQLEAEIEVCAQQEAQKKHWLRWGLASDAAGLILCVAVLLRVALTGRRPASPYDYL